MICCPGLTSETNPESGQRHTRMTLAAREISASESLLNRTRRVRLRPVTTSYAYDALHRLTTKSYSDGTPMRLLFTLDLHLGSCPAESKGSTPLATTGTNGTAIRRLAMIRWGVCESWQWTPFNYTTDVTGSFPVTYTHTICWDVTSTTNGKEGVDLYLTYDTAARSLNSKAVTTTPITPARVDCKQLYPLGELDRQRWVMASSATAI